MIRVLLLALGLALPAHAQPPLISDENRAAFGAIGRVNIGGFKSRGTCTGVLIAPDQVLTAAHCVANPADGTPHQLYRIHFVAGWHRGEHLGAAKARDVSIHFEFRPTSATLNARLIGADMAVIALDTPLAGLTPVPISQTGPEPGPVTIFGYRGDRPHILSHYQACRATPHAPQTLALSCAVAPGTSGAPVLQQQDGAWRVVGVVSARRLGDPLIKGLAARVDPLRLPGF